VRLRNDTHSLQQRFRSDLYYRFNVCPILIAGDRRASKHRRSTRQEAHAS
jgi:transcriptional regulator of acetoin/glycerol metabolism